MIEFFGKNSLDKLIELIKGIADQKEVYVGDDEPTDENVTVWIDSLPSSSPSGGSGSSIVKYSTDPVIVGEWIDGRPVYRQVIELGNILVSSNYAYSDVTDITNNLNLDFMITGTVYGEVYNFTAPARLFKQSNTYFLSTNIEMGSGYNKYWILDYVKRE